MIRYIIFVALCICTEIVSAIDHHAKDSLLLQLKHTTVSAQRISIYRNLADTDSLSGRKNIFAWHV